MSENINKKFENSEIDSVVIRFAGDSGDGIQVTGTRFSNESALAGNDIATLPNFPAEIRAPAGTLAGVSEFQINFGSLEINTPGDEPDVLVSMNPAALKANLKHLRAGGILVVNEDSFTEKNLSKVGFDANPLEDEKLKEKYRFFIIPISKLTKEALKDTGLSNKEVERCKNFFALGVMLWLFNRPTESTKSWIETKFKKKPEYVDANLKALEAGLTYAEATEIIQSPYNVKPAKLEPGLYRNLNGTQAVAYGLIAASKKSDLPIFFGAYPITPASELLHVLSTQKKEGVLTFQAEDEIAAVCSAIGASFAGKLGVTSSSGPGIALKTEAIALAATVELPLVVVNTMRAGPSTGMPTKTEQTDLLQAIYGRPGETPLCVLAPSDPDSAFELAYEAARIALKYMTPVFLLSDTFISNSSEPWLIRDTSKLKEIETSQIEKSDDFLPYERDEVTLSRPWAIPGTPGLEHRLGGLEKENVTGKVSYDPENHQLMTELRAEKIEKIQAEIPKTKIDGDKEGELLVLGWGSTEGAIKQACINLRKDGHKVSRAHVYHLNPLPSDLAEVLKGFKRVLIPEVNMGHFRSIIRDKFLVDAIGLNLVRGEPIKASEIEAKILEILKQH